MSSSDDAAFQDDDPNGNEAAAYSSSRSEGESSAGDSSHDDDDAIFISSRTEVVISPRRRVGASLWGQLEERMDAQHRSGAQSIAEQLGVDALCYRRAAATPCVDAQRKSSKTKPQLTMSSSSTSKSKTTRPASSSNSKSKTRETRTTTTIARDDSGDARVTTKRNSSRSASAASREGMVGDNRHKPQRTEQRSATKRSHRNSIGVSASAINSKASTSRRRSGDARLRHHKDDDLERKSHSSNSAESSGGESEHHEGDSRRSQKEILSSRDDGVSASESSGEEEQAPQTKRRPSKQAPSEKPPRRKKSGNKTQPHAQRAEVPMSPSSAASSVSSSAFSQSSRPQTQKPASLLSDASALGFSAVLPSPKEEMEELKQTLKILASHDHNASNNMSESMAASSTTSAPGGEYLRVATGLMTPSPAEQLRLGEYVSSQPFANGLSGKHTVGGDGSSSLKQIPSGTNGGKESRHASFDPAALSAKLHARETNGVSRSKSMTADGSRGDEYQPSTRDDPRLSLNKKLFGQKPNSPYDNPFSSHMNGSSGSGTQGILGMGTGLGGAGASGGSAQGSRAVLSALKALQDKIRRLEEERETLMQQLSDEKVKARKREAELASSEKKFSYELGQTKQSARAAYDAIRSEREELKVELVRADERRKSLESEISHVQALLGTYSSKADDLQTQLEVSESQRNHLRSDLEQLKAELKSENQDLRAKVQALEQQDAANQEQLRLLDEQFQRESSNHAETRERLRDSEQSVASISQLNEKLVARVWEVTDVANKTAKQNKKLLSQQRVSTASKSTAASRASAAAVHAGRETGGGAGTGAVASRRATGGATASSARQRAGATGGMSEGATTSSRLRKKASTTSSGVTSGIKRTAGAKKPKSQQPSDAFASTNNMTLLRDANLGKEIPFLLGTSSNPSFSIIGNVQDAIRQCDSTYVTPDTLTGGAPIRIPTAMARAPRSAAQPAHDQQRQRTPKARRRTVKSSGGVSAKILGMNEVVATPNTLLSDRTRGSAAVEKRHKPSAIQVPPPAPVSVHINPMQTQIMDDLGAALQSAEQEFATLNTRYKDIVSRMKAEGNDSLKSDGDGVNGSSAQLSSALGPLLDELEAKGKQVNLLKQVYQQASNSSINPLRRIVHSPEAIRRKTASLRLLNEYRQLERDARSSPPHHRNASSSSFFSDHEQFY